MRSKIFPEQARVIEWTHYPAKQFVLRLHAPMCARYAKPGTFIHLQCEKNLPLRRPFSIMSTRAKDETIEILGKVTGQGTLALTKSAAGTSLSNLGPIGNPFSVSHKRPRILIIGGGVGIPSLVFLAKSLKGNRRYQSTVFFRFGTAFSVFNFSCYSPTSWHR